MSATDLAIFAAVIAVCAVALGVLIGWGLRVRRASRDFYAWGIRAGYLRGRRDERAERADAPWKSEKKGP